MPRSINYSQIKKKLLESRKVRDKLDNKIQAVFVEAKRELIEGFEKDLISQELMHPEHGNVSRTLDGKSNKSLFGFIGFSAESDPVGDVKKILENEIHLKQGLVTDKGIEYRVSHPSLKELYSKTPMPWESGRSWLYGISHGISGFSNFLAGFFRSPTPSRSGQGIQLEGDIREGAYKPRRYIEEYLSIFRKRFGKKV